MLSDADPNDVSQWVAFGNYQRDTVTICQCVTVSVTDKHPKLHAKLKCHKEYISYAIYNGVFQRVTGYNRQRDFYSL